MEEFPTNPEVDLIFPVPPELSFYIHGLFVPPSRMNCAAEEAGPRQCSSSNLSRRGYLAHPSLTLISKAGFPGRLYAVAIADAAIYHVVGHPPYYPLTGLSNQLSLTALN